MAYSIFLALPAERQLKALAEPVQKRIVTAFANYEKPLAPRKSRNWPAKTICIVSEKVTIESSTQFETKN